MRTKGENQLNLSKQQQNLQNSVKKGKFTMSKENMKKGRNIGEIGEREQNQILNAFVTYRLMFDDTCMDYL